MALRKNDPVYYKVKLSELIKCALSEGLSVQCHHLNDGVRISFVADNGDVSGIDLRGN
jgi:hypothetical protein